MIPKSITQYLITDVLRKNKQFAYNMVFIYNKSVTRHIDNIWDDISYWGQSWQTSDTLYKWIPKLKLIFDYKSVYIF